MAIRYSRATGNFTTAGTWGLVDSTSFLNSETSAATLTTSYVESTAFTPGAITVDGIAVKLTTRTGTTGTMSVHLAIAGVEVVGSAVTINTADLPVAAQADLNGGWHFFKFASPLTLVAATNYTVGCKTSSANQISLWTLATTNWSRALVTTTTGAPAAGDDVIIGGEYTGAGTSNSFVVTYDETATTDYGSTPTSANGLVQPGIAVCNKGNFLLGTAAATNYNLRLSNHFMTYSGGVTNFGTVATPMPRGSTFTLQLDCGANVDYSLFVRNLGTFTSQALSRTSGKNIVKCLLNTDEAANSTSLGVDTDTGWLDNDEIAVASTTRSSTPGNSELGAMNGNAGASTLTVDGFAGTGGGLLIAHSGTSPTQAEVIMLTRSIVIRGASASLQGFVFFSATSSIDIAWTEFKWLGAATSSRRGVDVATTSAGSFSCQFSSFHNFEVASSIGLNLTGTTGTYTVSNNVFWLIASSHIINSSTTTTNWTIDSNTMIRNSDAANIVSLGDVGGTFTNNTIVSSNNLGLALTDTNGAIGTISNIIIHSCSSAGIQVQSSITGTMTNFTIWRNNSGGILLLAGEYIMDTVNLFGNATTNIQMGSNQTRVTFRNLTSNGDTTFSTPDGVRFGANGQGGDLVFENCNFGTASGIKTAHTNDINVAAFGITRIFLVNTVLASATEVNLQVTLSEGSFISAQKLDGTTGNHKTWKRYGTLARETTTTHTGGTSLKMTPNNASFKLTTQQGLFGGFKIAVANGQTVTPSVYVYEDASYNGARARLILKRNDALGITADVVLDTATAASDLAWEQLTGTTAAATDDGTMEFMVDADGTSGNLYVDSFSVT